MRSVVDHHMRRCDDCRNLGRRLTSPAELFGGLIAVPVPGSLREGGRDQVLIASHRHDAGPGLLRWVRNGLLRRLAGLAGLALLALATLLVVHQRSDAASSAAPATFSPAAPSHGSAEPSSGTPSPSSATPIPQSTLPGGQPASPGTPSLAPTGQPSSGPVTATPATSPAAAPSPTSGVALPLQPAPSSGRYRRQAPVSSP
jgi:hypothetical protein